MVGDRKGDASVPPGVTAPGRRPSMARLGESGGEPQGGPEQAVPGGGLDALDAFAATVRDTATPAARTTPHSLAPPTVPPPSPSPSSVTSPSVEPPSGSPPGTPEVPTPPPDGPGSGPAARVPEPTGAEPASGDLAAAVAATGTVVTDEDRNRFGMLLDRSLERGLLSPVEYDVRLGRLAEATTVEEMTDIVTDFPAFQAQAEALANLGKKGRRATGRVVVPAGALGTTSTETPRRLNSWILLTIVILVLAAATVILLVTMRTVHNRPPTGVVTRTAPTLLVAPVAPTPPVAPAAPPGS